MPHIHVLDQITIDKIAAGEVIERPASIVKELVENAIDAGATSVKIEIKDGGISFIRITDNGCGIPQDEVQRAFLRHSTSKIETVEDLSHIASLGFRGEALSSIAAVTRTELITKTADAEFGTRYVIEGGKEVSLEDTGAPNGTTFLVHQLFYNVPARRKFLKTPMTEAGHVQDLLMHLALSHPEVAFQFLNNGQEKLRTSGNGKLKDVIYNVYGRDVAANKFPFAVLHFHLSGENVDINVHPTKMELRFSRQQEVYNTVFEAVHRTLLEPELIQKAEVPDPVESNENMAERPERVKKTFTSASTKDKEDTGSPFLLRPRKKNEKVTAAELIKESKETVKDDVQDEDYFIRKMKERVLSYHNRSSSAEVADRKEIFRADEQKDKIAEHVKYAVEAADKTVAPETAAVVQKSKPAVEMQTATTRTDAASDCEITDAKSDPENGTQMNLFEENFLKRDIRAEYKLIGQVFDTYWLVEFKDNLYIIDQHAAHERVLYERTLREMKSREFTSQYLSPPIILSLSMQEAQLLNENMDRFSRIGFEIEPFGGEEYAVRAVPDNLFSIAKKELLMEMIDDLTEGLSTSMTPELIDEKVASLSCKAAVKGNNRLSAQEVDKLIGELLTLDNPYHCPHGRPTIIAMTKRDLEKKFKRII